MGSSEKQRKALRDTGEGMTVGLVFGAAVGVGFGLGWWIDGLVHTRPILAIVGAMLGIGAGFVNLFEVTGRMANSGKDEKSDSEDES